MTRICIDLLYQLDDAFAWKEERTVSNNLTLQYDQVSVDARLLLILTPATIGENMQFRGGDAMRSPFYLFVSGLFSAVCLSASSCFALDWEVERNFRYLVYPSDAAIPRVAADAYFGQRGRVASRDDLELFTRLFHDPPLAANAHRWLTCRYQPE
jgi:hypothetical protein